MSNKQSLLGDTYSTSSDDEDEAVIPTKINTAGIGPNASNNDKGNKGGLLGSWLKNDSNIKPIEEKPLINNENNESNFSVSGALSFPFLCFVQGFGILFTFFIGIFKKQPQQENKGPSLLEDKENGYTLV
ncbi:hypothetical protein ABK040_009855 [Willaertia magna]